MCYFRTKYFTRGLRAKSVPFRMSSSRSNQAHLCTIMPAEMEDGGLMYADSQMSNVEVEVGHLLDNFILTILLTINIDLHVTKSLPQVFLIFECNTG